MSAPLQFDGVEQSSLPAKPLHLAIGIFDGVHRGHRAVIAPAVEAARREGGLAAVLTFWPHPSVLFCPENPTPMMQTPAMKAKVLATLGVDAVITQPFTPEFAEVRAGDFLPWLKQRLPKLVAVYVGENFRFGHGREGDALLLKASAKQLGLHAFSAPRATLDDQPISSTRVRAQIAAGDIEQANALLGYPYFTEGRVAPGKRLGRTLGFPTLNLPWAPELHPRHGVYAVRVSGEKAREALRGVANYGLRPTVEQTTEPRLEVHVLDECPFGEGDVVTVEWLRFLRGEKKFANVGELRAQIARDRDAAAEFFRSAG